jgi:hypothetical protein
MVAEEGLTVEQASEANKKKAKSKAHPHKPRVGHPKSTRVLRPGHPSRSSSSEGRVEFSFPDWKHDLQSQKKVNQE